MERWRGRVAVVTGASAGIGAAIVYQLQDAGVNVVGLARRKEKIQGAVEAARRAADSRGRKQVDVAPAPGQLHCLQCDVSKEEDVLAAFQWVRDNVGGVDVLVNNAGICRDTSLTETNIDNWISQWDTNVLGLSICTREAVQQLNERGVNDGHIIHIGSGTGHRNPTGGTMAMYYATKHAVRVLTEGLRKELVAAKSRIRVTEVSPGFVRSDIALGMSRIDMQALAQMPALEPEDVADCVLYVLGLPAHVQVHNIMVKPVGQKD